VTRGDKPAQQATPPHCQWRRLCCMACRAPADRGSTRHSTLSHRMARSRTSARGASGTILGTGDRHVTDVGADRLQDCRRFAPSRRPAAAIVAEVLAQIRRRRAVEIRLVRPVKRPPSPVGEWFLTERARRIATVCGQWRGRHGTRDHSREAICMTLLEALRCGRLVAIVRGPVAMLRCVQRWSSSRSASIW
jgi:hypothetical protein